MILAFHSPSTLHRYYHPEKMLRIDHLLLAGRYQYLDAKQYLLPKIPQPVCIHEAGYPKLDRVIRINSRLNSRRKDSMLHRLGLSPARRTILLAPTWGLWSILNEYQDDIIEVLRKLSQHDFNIIVKLHPNSFSVDEKHTLGVDWPSKFKHLADTADNIYICSKWSDSGYFLTVADLMITDESSVGIEFTCLSKPIVFLKTAPKCRTSMKDPGIEISKRGEMGYETDSIEKAFDVLVNNYDKIRHSDLRNYILFDPGRSAQTFYRKISELILTT